MARDLIEERVTNVTVSQVTTCHSTECVVTNECYAFDKDHSKQVLVAIGNVYTTEVILSIPQLHQMLMLVLYRQVACIMYIRENLKD